MPDKLITVILLTIKFRIVERATLTLLVIGVCLWLIRKYTGEFTKIRAKADEWSLPSVSVTIGTPILIATLFIGYTYVDLSNQIEVGYPVRPPQTKSEEKPAPAADTLFDWRGFNDVGQAALDARERSSPRSVTAEKSLRRVFVSLSNMPRALTPQVNARLINLAIGVVCLYSENAAGIDQNFDRFIAGKDFDQVEASIKSAMRATTFANGFCQQMKAEFGSE